MYAYLNLIHILYLFLPILMLICFYYALKDKLKKVQTVFFLCCIGVSSAISLYDMFANVREDGIKSVLCALPLYACDLNNIILPIAVLKKGKKPILNKFVLYYIVTGPIYTLLSPIATDGMYYFYDYEVWSKFVAHSIYIVVAVLYLKLNHIKCNSKEPWKVFSAMIILMTVVHCVNLFLIYTGLYIDANYFFTGHPPNVAIVYRIAIGFGYNIPFVRCYFMMFMAYLGETIIIYFVHKITETEFVERVRNKIKSTFKVKVDK